MPNSSSSPSQNQPIPPLPAGRKRGTGLLHTGLHPDQQQNEFTEEELASVEPISDDDSSGDSDTDGNADGNISDDDPSSPDDENDAPGNIGAQLEAITDENGNIAASVPASDSDQLSKYSICALFSTSLAMLTLLCSEPTTFREAMSGKDSPIWSASMQDEMQSHLDCGTFELVPYIPW